MRGGGEEKGERGEGREEREEGGEEEGGRGKGRRAVGGRGGGGRGRGGGGRGRRGEGRRGRGVDEETCQGDARGIIVEQLQVPVGKGSMVESFWICSWVIELGL